MSVFDPLAVALTVAINVAISHRKTELENKENETHHSLTEEPIIPSLETTPTYVNNNSDEKLNSISSRLDSISDSLNSNSKRNEIINSMREDV